MMIIWSGLILFVAWFIYKLYYKKLFNDWLLLGYIEELDTDDLLNQFKKLSKRMLAKEGERMAYGRATVFMQEFSDFMTEEAEPLAFSPVRSLSKMEFKEYGLLATTEGLIVKYQLSTEKPDKDETVKSYSEFLPFEGLWRIDQQGDQVIVRYPEKSLRINTKFCSSFTPEFIHILEEIFIKTGFSRNLYLWKLATNNETIEAEDINRQLRQLQQESHKLNKDYKKMTAAGMATGIITPIMGISNLSQSMTDIQLNSVTKQRNFTLRDNLGNEKVTIRKTGHGEAAEYANSMVDRFKFKNVEDMGSGFSSKVEKGQGVNAVDRVVNGQKIQSKYLKTAEATAKSFNNGNYPDDVALEVPKDQYEDVKRIMKEVDPDRIIVKGNVTYDFAQKVCKAGTIESLTIDAMHGVYMSLPGATISFALTLAQARWNGMSFKEAVKVSASVALRAVVVGSMIYTGSQQFAKTAFSKSLAKQWNLTSVDMAAYSSLAIVGGIMYGPDIVDALRGRISPQQLMKNTGITTLSMVGGTVGVKLVTGALATTPLGMLGAMVGAQVAGSIGKKVLDKVIVDDSEELYEILREEFIDGAIGVGLNQDEVNQMIDLTFANKKYKKMMKDVYQAGKKYSGQDKRQAQRVYIREVLIDKNVIEVIKSRDTIRDIHIIKAQEKIAERQLGIVSGF